MEAPHTLFVIKTRLVMLVIVIDIIITISMMRIIHIMVNIIDDNNTCIFKIMIITIIIITIIVALFIAASRGEITGRVGGASIAR